MATTKPTSSDTRQLIINDSSQLVTINLSDALLRQKRIIFLCTLLGCCLAYLYFQNAKVKYTSTARVMVNQRDTGLIQNGDSSNAGEYLINEDVLANHAELLSSRKNVTNALTRANLMQLSSLIVELEDDEDVVDYVIDNLKLSRGGKGVSKAARTILLEFTHTDSTDSMLVLQCVIDEYMLLIEQQFEDSLAIANTVIIESQKEIQAELQSAQQNYIDSRKNAPVLFTGEGSSNVYVDQFKTLSNQLMDLEIEQSTTLARLEKATEVAQEYSNTSKVVPLQALGVIDTDSLERLGVFANMRADSTRSSDFQKNQPERQEEARAQYTQLLTLMLDKQRLEADFGAGHPDVQKLQQEIELVRTFLDENKVESDAQLDEAQITSRQLLAAYIGFLTSEVQSLAERKGQLTTRIEHAETQARSLVNFELKNELLRSQIDRNQQLFDGLVEQLRTLNVASTADGYLHEILESPRPGIRIWPKLSIVAAAGLILGLFGGLFAALVNDQLNGRFQTAGQMDSMIGLPVLGYIDRLSVSRKKMLVDLASADSESFRMLRTLLLSDVRSGKLSSLVATSASPGDGKSTLLMNIAASFARVDMPVVIVEADMRRPTMKKRLRLSGKPGLSELLQGKASLEDCICETGVDNLQIIHAGSPTSTPAELLESESFDALLKELRSRFVLTVVDVGPVLAVSDPLVIAQKVDGTMLIVRPSVDTRQEIAAATNTLRTANVNLLGMIVNTYGSTKSFKGSRYNYGNYQAAQMAELV